MKTERIKTEKRGNSVRTTLISGTGILVLLLLLRWNGFTMPFERDEGEYAYSAWLLGQHALPYENSFLQKPPLIIYLYAAGQMISGDSVALPRIFAVLFTALAIFLTGAGTARLSGRRAGLTTAWIMAAMLGFGGLSPYAANTELFMLAPLSALLYLYSCSRRSASARGWFFAGVLGMTAVLFKPISLLLVLYMLAVWGIEIRKETGSAAGVFKKVIFAFGGSLTLGVLALLPFLIHDGGRAMAECVITYNRYYALITPPAGTSLSYFFGLFWKSWWIIILLTAWFFINRPRFWWYPAGLAVLAIATIFRSQTGHYYIMLVPFWAMIGAMALESLYDRLKNFFSPRAPWRAIIGTAIVIIVLLIPCSGQIMQSPGELTRSQYGEYNPFREAPEVGREIAAMTTSGNTVYVAGSEPEILYYAKRRSPTRFVISYPLTIPTPLAAGYQEEVVDVLTQSPPDVIVFARSNLSWLRQNGSPMLIFRTLNDLIAQKYHPVGGITPGGQWFGKAPDQNEAKNASLLVYRRNQ